MAIDTYYYDGQIKRYLVQFMEIFTALQVKTGKRAEQEFVMLDVPIRYGSRDRVTAAILAKNTQNSAVRVPLMSTYLRSVDLAPEMRKGVGGERRESYLPKGGMLPNDILVAKQMMPVPYMATIELNLYTSNLDQHFQIMEQILMYFDPTLQIQTNDDKFDWTKISVIELTNISFDENYPIGTDSRVILTTLNFKMPIWIAAPTDRKDEFVHTIKARISTPSTFEEFIDGIFQAEDADYFTVVSADELQL